MFYRFQASNSFVFSVALFFMPVVFICSCAPAKQAITTAASQSVTINGKLFASFYQQSAAEYAALCFQSYQLAKWRLDEELSKAHAKPLAIVTDIDETVLDNSKYAVHEGLAGKDYDPKTWKEWVDRAEADTIAGARWFLNYAASKNVTVFYITNRNEDDRAGTIRNLQNYRFPNSDNEHLLLRQTTSGKEMRRQQVAKAYDIVLLLGDNLSDFTDLFDKRNTDERFNSVQSLSRSFGTRFIVLPNPVYGDWESAANNNRGGLSQAGKDSLIRARLRGY